MNYSKSQLQTQSRRFFLFVFALALCLHHAQARSLGDNCKAEWSQRGECGDLACAIKGFSYPQCAPAGTTGDKCLAHVDCARDHFCGIPDFACRPALGSGATCSFGDNACDKSRGLTCSNIGVPGKCVELLEKGVRCTYTYQCVEDAFCDGICMARRVNGEDCKTDAACDDGLSCVFGVCVKHPERGSSCESETISIGDKPTGLFSSNCAGDLACVSSSCVARNLRPTDGSPKPSPDESLSPSPGVTGMTLETKIGLGVGIPSVALTFIGVVIGYWQLKSGRTTSKS